MVRNWWRMRLALKILLVRILQKLTLYPRGIYYIGGSEALPPPLSSEEEGYLLGRLKTGDPAVRSLLIEHNLRLVVYIARKFENTGIGIEDLVSIGAIGLIKAVNTFDPDKKIKLATYASRCIENEILMFLRRNSKLRSEVSLMNRSMWTGMGTNCSFRTFWGPKMTWLTNSWRKRWIKICWPPRWPCCRGGRGPLWNCVLG